MTALATFIINQYPELEVSTCTRGRLLTKHKGVKIGIYTIHRDLCKLGVLPERTNEDWRQAKKDEELIRVALHSIIKGVTNA